MLMWALRGLLWLLVTHSETTTAITLIWQIYDLLYWTNGVFVSSLPSLLLGVTFLGI